MIIPNFIISHLLLFNFLFRTAFTYLSGILTFVVAWVIFGLDSKSKISEDTSKDFMVKYFVFVKRYLTMVRQTTY